MAIGIYFRPQSMKADQYDETMRRLDQAGQAKPKGRSYHCCFGKDGELQVFDIWESQAAFDEFGKTLMPILQEIGLDPGQPMVEPVHNVVT